MAAARSTGTISWRKPLIWAAEAGSVVIGRRSEPEARTILSPVAMIRRSAPVRQRGLMKRSMRGMTVPSAGSHGGDPRDPALVDQTRHLLVAEGQEALVEVEEVLEPPLRHRHQVGEQTSHGRAVLESHVDQRPG